MTTNYREVPWARNLRKVPAQIETKLKEAPDAQFVAGVVRKISASDLEKGIFEHLGMSAMNGGVLFKERVRPRADMGGYSKKNREGWEVVRRDLPMVTRSFAIETPNFGDWGNGSHTVWVDREVYQRDYFDPPNFELIFEQLRTGSDGSAVFKVIVDYALDRTVPDFQDDLLFALNLLQENLGTADVLPRDAIKEELLSTLGLEWEIFPPGTVSEVVQRTLSRMGGLPPDREALVRERITLFNRLRPKRFIQGRGGMSRYIGAMFADDLVVFENVNYGNALYVLYDDWQDVSQRSRIDLLKCRDADFDRFVHREGWQRHFAEHIRDEKRRRGIKDSDSAADERAA